MYMEDKPTLTTGEYETVLQFYVNSRERRTPEQPDPAKEFNDWAGEDYEKIQQFLKDKDLHDRYDHIFKLKQLQINQYNNLPDFFKNDKYYIKKEVSHYGTYDIYERQKDPVVMWDDWIAPALGGGKSKSVRRRKYKTRLNKKIKKNKKSTRRK